MRHNNASEERAKLAFLITYPTLDVDDNVLHVAILAQAFLLPLLQATRVVLYIAHVEAGAQYDAELAVSVQVDALHQSAGRIVEENLDAAFHPVLVQRSLQKVDRIVIDDLLNVVVLRPRGEQTAVD